MIKHGHRVKRTPTYYSWASMKKRCTNPNEENYYLYGGRGITFCKQWDLFTNFLNDMGERPYGKTLDRIDPNGNYEPSNCRWATNLQQGRNKRKRAA